MEQRTDMRLIMSDLLKARDLLRKAETTINVDADERGFETDAETNCLYYIQSAIDGLCETIEFYAADCEQDLRTKHPA